MLKKIEGRVTKKLFVGDKVQWDRELHFERLVKTRWISSEATIQDSLRTLSETSRSLNRENKRTNEDRFHNDPQPEITASLSQSSQELSSK